VTSTPAAETEISDSLARLAILEERRRFDEARALLREVLPRHPSDPELLFHAAYIEYLTDNYAAAETAVQSLLAVAPGHVGGRDVLQGIYAETKRPAEAEQVLIGLLGDYPEDPYFYARYSTLMLQNLQAEKAEKLAAEALRLDPDDYSAQLAMTTARLITGKADTAQHDLARLVKNHPESMATLRMVVVSLTDQRRNKEALTVAQEMVRAYPDEPSYVDLVVELRKSTHWSLLPMWPMVKFGWAGAAAVWVLGIVLLRSTSSLGTWGGVMVGVWLLYVVYTWAWPPLLERWLRR
jgi:predicted Zn-dependent protease